MTIPDCDAVTCLGECFSYLFDKRNRLSALNRIFRRVYSRLPSGGLLIFDVAEPGRGKQQHQGFRQEEDWSCLVSVQEDTTKNQLTRFITSYRRVGRWFRRHEEVHRLQLYRGPEVATALRKIGFRVRIVRSYGSYPLPKGLVGFIARKP